MANNKPDKPHIHVELYKKHMMPCDVNDKAVVSVNQLAGIVFLPQVAGVFFGIDSHDRARELACHISNVSGLEVHEVDNYASLRM